jgi:hypothetical protein
VKEIKTPELVFVVGVAAASAVVVAGGVVICVVVGVLVGGVVVVGGTTQNDQQTPSHVIWLCIYYIHHVMHKIYLMCHWKHLHRGIREVST